MSSGPFGTGIIEALKAEKGFYGYTDGASKGPKEPLTSSEPHEVPSG